MIDLSASGKPVNVNFLLICWGVCLTASTHELIFYIASFGLSCARFLPGILVTFASCPHFFRMTVAQAVSFSFSGIQSIVLNSRVKRNHSNSTKDNWHQYGNQESRTLAAQLRLQICGRRSFVIQEEMLTFLFEKGFKVLVMAQLLMVSTGSVGEAR